MLATSVCRLLADALHGAVVAEAPDPDFQVTYTCPLKTSALQRTRFNASCNKWRNLCFAHDEAPVNRY